MREEDTGNNSLPRAYARGIKLGSNEITPYFRTLKSDGEINPKYPGGIQIQKMLLEKEGHKIIQRGKKYFVENYQNKLKKI